MREDHQKERPMGGQWAEQQKRGMKKQAEVGKHNRQAQNDPSRHQQSGAGEQQSSPIEPEQQGGIGGP